MKYFRYIICIFCLLFILTPAVHAECACDPGPILPCCACLGNCNYADLVFMLMKFTNYALGALAIISIVLFVHAGFRLIISHGNQERIGVARKEISGAVMGFIVVLLSWVIINSLIVLLTGNTRGFLFPGMQGGDKPWYKIEYEGECKDPTLTCKTPPQDASGCVDSDKCASGMKCCP